MKTGDGNEEATMRRSRTVPGVMVVLLSLLIGASPAVAADSPVGTWVKKEEGGKPAMTLTIEAWSATKAKLTWRIPDAKLVLTLESALDGSFAIGGNKIGKSTEVWTRK
jgi:hypothetical protein